MHIREFYFKLFIENRNHGDQMYNCVKLKSLSHQHFEISLPILWDALGLEIPLLVVAFEFFFLVHSLAHFPHTKFAYIINSEDDLPRTIFLGQSSLLLSSGQNLFQSTIQFLEPFRSI